MANDSHKDFDPGARSDEGLHKNVAWNPYTDRSLIETQPDPVTMDSIESREPFNDAIKHQDLILGYRRNRTLSDYPRQVRPWVRLGSIIVLLAFVCGLVWDYVH